MEIFGNYDTKTNQWVLTPKQLNLVIHLDGKDQATELDAKFIETSSALKHNVDELLVGVVKQMLLRKEKKVETRESENQRQSRV